MALPAGFSLCTIAILERLHMLYHIGRIGICAALWGELLGGLRGGTSVDVWEDGFWGCNGPDF